MTLGTYPAISLAQARQAWRDARQDVAAGRDPAKVRKREEMGTNFKSVADEWLDRDQSKNKIAKLVRHIVERDLVPVWGHRAVTDITRRDVRDLIDSIADRGAPIGALRVHAYVHRFFRWCVGRDIIEANPAADMPKPGSETKRDRVLSDEELTAVWNAAGNIGWPYGDAIRLLILTGARREEIGQLRWSEIKGDEITSKALARRTERRKQFHCRWRPPQSCSMFRASQTASRVFTTNGKDFRFWVGHARRSNWMSYRASQIGASMISGAR